MKKAVIIALAAFALAIAPTNAKAQWTVFDPANFHNAVLRYWQLRYELAQLQATYTQTVNQYSLAVRMARNIPNMASRYTATWAPWRYASAQDLYGNSNQWVNGVNTGIVATVRNGYQRATNRLQAYSQSLLASMPATEKQRVQSDSATVELTDGAAENSMETIGAIRNNAVATTNTINNIQGDSLSGNPNLNTQVSVLNKVNATSVLVLQNAQDTNKLLVALLEHQTIQAKQLRDAQTDAITHDINRRANTVPMNRQFAGGFGAALASYQLP